MAAGDKRSSGHGATLFLGFTVTLLLSLQACGEILEIDIQRTDLRSALLGRFGFSSEGRLELNVSKLSIFSPEKASAPDTYSMGFVLIHQSQIASSGVNQKVGFESEGKEGTTLCPLTNLNITKILSVMDMKGPESHGQRPQQSTSLQIGVPGLYSAYLINCAAPSRLISCHVSLSMYNEPEPTPGSKEPGKPMYLSSGAWVLIIINVLCSLACVVIFVLWILHVRQVWCNGIAPHTYHIYLTALLPILATLFSLMAARLFVVLRTGHALKAWNVPVAVFCFLAAVLVFATFIAAFPSLDPYISDLERAGVYITIPLFIVASVVLAILNADSVAAIDASSLTVLQQFLSLTPSPNLSASPSEAFALLIQPYLALAASISLGLLALLLGFVFVTAFLRHLHLRRIRGSGKRTVVVFGQTEQDQDGLFLKFYVQGSFALLGACCFAALLLGTLPFYLASSLPMAVVEVASVAYLAHVLYRYRPRTERSVYQLFDESDTLDDDELGPL